MTKVITDAEVEEYLFGNGLILDSYFIEETPVSEVLCYQDESGRSFDLLIDDQDLAASLKRRLREMGVRVVRLS